jgi:adenylosuccinate synthase
MPVTVVVGGQFGSEGKGKIAHFLAKETNATLAVRVGGPNSGHTVVNGAGVPVIFRHLPTACVLPNTKSVIPPGAYLNVPLLLQEIASIGPQPHQLAIDPHAWVITDGDVDAERRMQLPSKIGSTGSGTGGAVIRRVARDRAGTFAKDVQELRPFIAESAELLSKELSKGNRVVVEGTQGFGLSLLHSSRYPNCTGRDTTAAAFISESGLSPLDVDDVVLVIRAHPIRVGGNSGPLSKEITWETVTAESGSPEPLLELTSVTRKARRIARFDPEVVKQAIRANRPTRIALNHLDYVDFQCRSGQRLTQRGLAFVHAIEREIGRRVDLVGVGPAEVVWRNPDRKIAVRA